MISNLKTKKSKYYLFIFLSLSAILMVLFLGLMLGSQFIPFSTVLKVLTNKLSDDDLLYQIVFDVRLPRMLIAMLLGIALSLAGTMMQAITQNELSEPGILGINAGSVFAITLALAFFSQITFTGMLAASFLGGAAVVSILFIIQIYGKKQIKSATLVLIGMCLSMFGMSMGQLVSYIFDIQRDISYFLAGNIANVSWEQLWQILPIIAITSICVLFFGKTLTMLSIGEDASLSMGLSLGKMRAILLFLTLLLTASSTVIAGSISFIGLIAPHFARTIVGNNYRYVLPFSAVIGALLMLVSDVISRSIHPPFETPIGAIIAIIGVPTFLLVMKNNKNLR